MKISLVVRQRCKELAKTIKESVCGFAMKRYTSLNPCTKIEYDEAINLCSTAVDVVGHIPLSNPECTVSKGVIFIDFFNTSKKFLGLEYSSALWRFLFSENWSNDKEQSIKRLLYVADRGEIHPDFAGGTGEDGYNWKLVLE